MQDDDNGVRIAWDWEDRVKCIGCFIGTVLFWVAWFFVLVMVVTLKGLSDAADAARKGK